MTPSPQDERPVPGSSAPSPAGGPSATSATAPAQSRFSYRRLLNATGIIFEPGIGGPPLPVLAQRAVADVAAGYSTLGQDPSLASGIASQSGVEHWLTQLTGAPAALAVNSSAGAILLVLAALASERKVLVSRAELFEAGRALGLSEIVTKSGARFVEVGTAQKTRVADFERAFERYSSIAAILRVPSPSVPIGDLPAGPGPNPLTELARKHEVPLIEDLGNGAIVELARYGLEGRRSIADSLAAGADVVRCSGSLLLTGSQVGLIRGALGGSRAGALRGASALRRGVCDATAGVVAHSLPSHRWWGGFSRTSSGAGWRRGPGRGQERWWRRGEGRARVRGDG